MPRSSSKISLEERKGDRMSRIWHVIYLAAIAASVAFALRPAQPQAKPPAAPQADPLAFQAALIQHTNNFEHVTWLGHPIWQSVPDVWTLQETIAEIKPALVIECGTYKGGSALFMAHLFDLLGHGQVVTVDIEKLHALSHPRVTFLIGDSVSPAIIGEIRNAAAKAGGPIMVLLDSDHSQAHVLKEMEAYGPMVTPGSYLHVQDGVIDVQPMFAHARPGPLRAIEAFLPKHREFEIDQEKVGRFLITHHPEGWLKRI
jgi:cephalosporin hydroxylase